ncbi:hypothetical protein CBR_g26443 [Chara braunii]|uniref:RING-type E3 ubiquitin transferase n=1 Tax=Chara braunii TaxID=69332 RepID=A0A388L7X8_CHABU|nr:hypothetical protein CBR_g26443 [Chara braunii]|eukprot:GBG78415.1 hypothetical protein CBR_g26443 [Chara braunii]
MVRGTRGSCNGAVHSLQARFQESISQRRVRLWLLAWMFSMQMLSSQVMVTCGYSDTASAHTGRMGVMPFVTVSDNSSGSLGIDTSPWNHHSYKYTMNKSVEYNCKHSMNDSDTIIEKKHGSIPSQYDTVRGSWFLSRGLTRHGKNFLNSTSGRVHFTLLDFFEHPPEGGPSRVSIRFDLRPMSLPRGYDASAFVNVEGVYSDKLGELCLVGCSRAFYFAFLPESNFIGGNFIGGGLPVDYVVAEEDNSTVVPTLASDPSPYSETRQEENITSRYSPSWYNEVRENENVTFWYHPDNYYWQTIDCRPEDCEVKVDLKLAQAKIGWRWRLQGSITSLCAWNHSFYSEPISLDLEVVTQQEYHNLEILREHTESMGLIIELLSTLFQLLYMTFRPEQVPWISITMVVLHVGVRCYRWFQNVLPPFMWDDVVGSSSTVSSSYIPFDYWMTSPFPLTLELCLMTFLAAFAALILKARRQLDKAKPRGNGEETAVVFRQQASPTEWPVLLVCVLLYGGAALVAWTLFDMYLLLDLMRDYYLLPQVLANAIWDSRGQRPLHFIYTIGSTLSPFSQLLFGYHYRKTIAYDGEAPAEFGLFCNLTGMIMLLCLLHSQQSSFGGRWFLPKRWFKQRRAPVTEEEISLVEKGPSREGAFV